MYPASMALENMPVGVFALQRTWANDFKVAASPTHYWHGLLRVEIVAHEAMDSIGLAGDVFFFF